MDIVAQTLQEAIDTASKSIEAVENARKNALNSVLSLSRVEDHVLIFGSGLLTMKGDALDGSN